MRKDLKSQRIEQGKALWFVCGEEIAFFKGKLLMPLKGQQD
jgi:hypothetical protein